MKTIKLHASTIAALRARTEAEGFRLVSTARPLGDGLFSIALDDDLVFILELIDPDPETAIIRALSAQLGRA